ncbi:MAG: DUF1343 domain-containing protein [Deltaproteobacteria bacterium]|jgi:uncharacterized protein YbbC (DUF1343 family)|nr:DUF1343 domain-containing protein [Deltaproteobacteria bacterium]
MSPKKNPPSPGPVATGLSVFLALHAGEYRNKAIGLLANQASVGPGYRHALELLDEKMPGAIKKVFSPQHGFAGEKQDNMIESGHSRLPDGRPVHSLYADKRKPDPQSLSGLDVFMVDLQDVGTRVYTFAHTVNLALEACAEAGLEVLVLDRPNPIGGLGIEGNLLDPDCRSFVGLQPVPMRHSLTMAELAIFANSRLPKPARLTVIPMAGWDRGMYFPQTGLNWVMPSPNLPDPATAWLYPGAVVWEGTNVSEGRGTTRPFHLFGAPYVDSATLAADLKALNLPDLAFRQASFQPTFNKWAERTCHGLELYPLGPAFKPYLTALSILQIILRRWPGDFKLKDPPYEYEFETRPIDLILGRLGLFDALASGIPAKDLCDSFAPELKAFAREIKTVRIY